MGLVATSSSSDMGGSSIFSLEANALYGVMRSRRFIDGARIISGEAN